MSQRARVLRPAREKEPKKRFSLLSGTASAKSPEKSTIFLHPQRFHSSLYVEETWTG